MDDSTISLTGSDVFQQTTPHIAKPPRHFYQDVDDNDDVDDDELFRRPTSPPRDHYSFGIIIKAAKQDETDGGGDDDDQTCRSQSGEPNRRDKGVIPDGGNNDAAMQEMPPLDADVITDGPKKDNGVKETAKSDGSADKKPVNGEDVGDESGGRPAANDGSDGGNGEIGGQGSSANSYVMPNQKGQNERKDIADGDFDEENVTELVDRAEAEVEAISKGERGAFDGLVAVLRVLLPMVLFMADELRMLRDKMKNLIFENRSLGKELHLARQEIRTRKDVETISVGISALIQDDVVESAPPAKCSHCEERDEATKKDEMEKQGNENATAEEDQMNLDAIRRENRKLRHQCRELVQVNHAWEKYSAKQEKKHTEALNKVKTQLAASEKKKEQLEKRLDDKFRQYDQTLLHAKDRERQQRAASEQYRRDRDILREKYDDVKGKLKEVFKDNQEKDVEIRRLNELLKSKGTKRDIKVYKVMNAPVEQPALYAQAVDENGFQVRKQREDKPTKKASGGTATAVPSPVDPSPSDPYENLRRKDKDAKVQPRKQHPSPPLSPRGPPGYEKKGGPLPSLTTAELKDQVILYKEQMDAYRSDFNQERRDRETAIGQVDSLKKELEQTKKRLKEVQKVRKQEEHNCYMTSRQLGRLPKDTQEMRLKEFEQSRGRYNPANGRDYVDEYLRFTDDHIYADIE